MQLPGLSRKKIIIDDIIYNQPVAAFIQWNQKVSFYKISTKMLYFNTPLLNLRQNKIISRGRKLHKRKITFSFLSRHEVRKELGKFPAVGLPWYEASDLSLLLAAVLQQPGFPPPPVYRG